MRVLPFERCSVPPFRSLVKVALGIEKMLSTRQQQATLKMERPALQLKAFERPHLSPHLLASAAAMQSMGALEKKHAVATQMEAPVSLTLPRDHMYDDGHPAHQTRAPCLWLLPNITADAQAYEGVPNCIEISKPSFSVGRGGFCDSVFDSETKPRLVSKLHATLHVGRCV